MTPTRVQVQNLASMIFPAARGEGVCVREGGEQFQKNRGTEYGKDRGNKMKKKGKKEIKENKYYKRWHEYSKSEAPDSKPHFFAGYVSSKEDFDKLMKKRKNGKV